MTDLQNPTLESLPIEFRLFFAEFKEFKKLLTSLQQQGAPEKEKERLLNVQEAAQFLNLTVPTIYSKVSKGELPVMKRSKRLYFSSTELMDYLKQGRKKSHAEIEADANAYLSNK